MLHILYGTKEMKYKEENNIQACIWTKGHAKGGYLRGHGFKIIVLYKLLYKCFFISSYKRPTYSTFL
jgi:hypothetical protein